MRAAIISIIFFLSTFYTYSQTSTNEGSNPSNTVKKSTNLPSVKHNSFKRGERLEYEVSYGWIDAGEAIIEITEEKKSIAGRDVMHVVGKGNSMGTFNWFFKVRDTYETYLDADGVFPWIFVRDIEEGGFKMKQYYTFDQFKRKVKTKKGKQFDVPVGVQDMISAFYYARTFDFSDAKPNQVYEMHIFIDNELWPLRIRYLKKERIKVDKGTYDCMVFVPVVQEGRIFKKEEDMMVWVTDDENKIPIQAKAKILVGSVTMEIRDYSGLANPVSKVSD
ncbi:DUF3108 domain-containing protein [bacterium]|nr:DUF3108 domain-containing protein [bacterium]MDC1221333.1 DUF3108 domain-containing protein [Salibacteraceae bacterium]